MEIIKHIRMESINYKNLSHCDIFYLIGDYLTKPAKPYPQKKKKKIKLALQNVEKKNACNWFKKKSSNRNLENDKKLF